MTPEQFDRWRDFALRMARTCFRRKRRPDTRWIVEAVEGIFDGLDEDVPCLIDWDRSDPYPEGHPYYSRRYRCPCWHCRPTIGAPQGSATDCPYHCEDGHIYDYASPYYLGDMMSEWATHHVYHRFHTLASQQDIARFKAMEQRDEDRADAFRDAWAERWSDPVCACVRAGMDMASEPSAGVLGFTVADLRRMYPDGVPAWITDRKWHFGPLCGDGVRETRPFAEWADDTPVLL